MVKVSFGWPYWPSLKWELATHSSILAWKIPWTEESWGLQSVGLQRVGHDWLSDWAFPLIISPLLGWKLFMIWTMWIDCTFCSQRFLSSLSWLWLTVGTISSQVALVVKNLPANARDIRDTFDPWVKKILWRRKWQPTPVFLPGESHGQRSLVSYIQSIVLHRVRHDWSDLAWHGMWAQYIFISYWFGAWPYDFGQYNMSGYNCQFQTKDLKRHHMFPHTPLELLTYAMRRTWLRYLFLLHPRSRDEDRSRLEPNLTSRVQASLGEPSWASQTVAIP